MTLSPQDTEEPNSPEETSDAFFVIIPNWILFAASGTAIKLYGILSTYLSPTSDTVWPSRKTIAARLGMSRPDSIDKYLEELVTIGALEIRPRYREDGGRTSSGYRIMRLRTGPLPSKPSRGAPPQKRVGPSPQNRVAELRPNKNLETKGSLRSPKATGADLSTAGDNPVDNPPLFVSDVEEALPGQVVIWEPGSVREAAERLGSGAVVSSNAPGDPFAEFWKIYPRRDDKRRALLAFAKAARDTPVADILAGAARYRDDVNRDPAFTKQPATWLNAGSWENDALPPRGGNGRPTLMDKLANTAALTGRIEAAPWDTGAPAVGYSNYNQLRP